MKYPLDPEIRKRFDQLERLVFSLWLVTLVWMTLLIAATNLGSGDDTAAIIEAIEGETK